MTDQIPAGLTRDEASAVREWAEAIESTTNSVDLTTNPWSDRARAAARVILAVLPTPPTTAKENPEPPDQTLDDQMRPIVAAMRAAMRRDEHAYPEAKFLADLSGYIKDLEALLAQRPTLADMTVEERRECKWMQADVCQQGRVVITNPDRSGLLASILDHRGNVAYGAHSTVTPRPDLPRMEWPGDQKPAPAPALPDGWRPADHEDHGRVIVTNTIPNRNGNVCIVLPTIEDARGYDWDACRPDELTYINTGQEVGQ